MRQNEYVTAVLMDPSKAFDCLPNEILLSKLVAYGYTDEAVLLLKSYLPYRKQQIKLSNIASSWSDIKKGVQQGSILGPLRFNVFTSDILYFLEHVIYVIMLKLAQYILSHQILIDQFYSRVYFRNYAADCMPSFQPNHA